MNYNNETELCTFYIPSAPGKSRSPEEYSEARLTHQIYVYSTAHVLSAVLSGEHPWHGLSLQEVKQVIKKGGHPQVTPPNGSNSNSTDALLARVIDLAYEVDPAKRINAKQMLEKLIEAADQWK